MQCKTCHGTLTQLPLTKILTDPNDIAFTLAFLNPVVDLKLGDMCGEEIRNEREAEWMTR